MKNIFLSITLFLLSTQISCFKKQGLDSELNKSSPKGLLQQTAIERKSAISNTSYAFDIDLREIKASDSFSGVSTVTFDFLKSSLPQKHLTLDFEEGLILDVYINGQRIADFKYDNHFISLPKKHLKEDRNVVKIKYSHKYSTTGSGLYKFKDKTDGKIYIYTDFEPYDANLFAPVFDQPNLKATYRLSVKTLSNWQVISSVKEQYAKSEGLYKLWSFPKTQKFSTYLFSLHAGPYKVWTDTVKLKSKDISLRLFARPSLAKHIKPDFWFKTTKQGFNFFEKYFSTDYPYTKYDQVIVPDFNSGAMENVAAVTFNEVYVSREKTPLRSQRRALANVIFHEMAHMWFGNLVTMNWWNDLWLNESFATYMAATGLYYNTEYTESWISFFNRTKQWAYAEDQWRTTHPIEADIPSTSVATSNFDGITYGKGASSLKQLVFLIGEDNFKKGLADYFKKYGGDNTIRKNFIDSLQNHTEENLSSWTKEWLQNKGLNTVKAQAVCNEGSLKLITFTQGVTSGDKVYRTHKIKVALWNQGLNPKPDEIFEIKISGEKTKWTPKEPSSCPKAIFPNWEDLAYIQVNFDEPSFDYISKNITSFDSTLFKAQFWAIISNMVKFGNLAPEKVFPLLKNQLPKENDFDVLSSMLSLQYPYKSIFEHYADPKKAVTDRKSLSSLLKNLVSKSEAVDTKKLFFTYWVYNSYQDKPSEIYKCLTKCSFKAGFTLDIDKKWTLAKTLSAVRFKKNSYVTNLFTQDSSRRGVLNKLATEVRYTKDKTLWLKKALNSHSSLSLKERRTILSNLIPHAQTPSYYEFIQKSFFENIDTISDLPYRVQKSFARNFSPLFCGEFEKSIPITEEQIKGSQWHFSVKKSLLKSLDRDERCLKIKAASLKYNKKPEALNE